MANRSLVLLSMLFIVPIRLSVGYFAGLVVARLGLEFLGFFLREKQTTILQEEMLERSKYWDIQFAVLSAVVAALAGGVRVSMFWFWFVLVFGAICVMPVLPFKDGSLLPFGTPYVNEGPVLEKAIMLAVHASVAAAIAWCIHAWGRRDPQVRPSAASSSTLTELPN